MFDSELVFMFYITEHCFPNLVLSSLPPANDSGSCQHAFEDYFFTCSGKVNIHISTKYNSKS